ncbi:MAG: hypothetical protein M1371_05845 [Actinobacteria bacterium]|nr:hypothetical protein [Actinomycetota bacterium]
MSNIITSDMTGLIVGLGLWFALAWIPAEVARSKGYDFWKWYAYGFFLFPIALLNSIFLHNHVRRIIPLRVKK